MKKQETISEEEAMLLTRNLMKAKKFGDSKWFKNEQLPSGLFHVTEKMDGHRKVWLGKGKHIYNWRGKFNCVKLPEDIVKQMPKVMLEFELVVGFKEKNRNRGCVGNLLKKGE